MRPFTHVVGIRSPYASSAWMAVVSLLVLSTGSSCAATPEGAENIVPDPVEEERAGGSGTVVVAIMDAFPEAWASRAADGERVVGALIRTPTDSDLILLHDSATPPQLAGLLEDLQASRKQMPLADRGYIMLETHGGEGVFTYPDSAAPAMADVLHQLRNAPQRPLRNLGEARWTEFTASEIGL